MQNRTYYYFVLIDTATYNTNKKRIKVQLGIIKYIVKTKVKTELSLFAITSK